MQPPVFAGFAIGFDRSADGPIISSRSGPDDFIDLAHDANVDPDD